MAIENPVRGMYNLVKSYLGGGYAVEGGRKHPVKYICPDCLVENTARARLNPKNNLGLVAKACERVLVFTMSGSATVAACYACDFRLKDPVEGQLKRYQPGQVVTVAASPEKEDKPPVGELLASPVTIPPDAV